MIHFDLDPPRRITNCMLVPKIFKICGHVWAHGQVLSISVTLYVQDGSSMFEQFRTHSNNDKQCVSKLMESHVSQIQFSTVCGFMMIYGLLPWVGSAAISAPFWHSMPFFRLGPLEDIRIY